MKKALLLALITIVCLSSAFAFTGGTTPSGFDNGTVVDDYSDHWVASGICNSPAVNVPQFFLGYPTTCYDMNITGTNGLSSSYNLSVYLAQSFGTDTFTIVEINSSDYGNCASTGSEQHPISYLTTLGGGRKEYPLNSSIDTSQTNVYLRVYATMSGGLMEICSDASASDKLPYITGDYNGTGYYVQGDTVYAGNKSNTSEYEVYFVIIDQPVQIQGYFDGQFAYVGFFPQQDNYTYFVPFSNGSLTFFCNPSNVVLDDSIICTGTLVDDNGDAINNANIDWELFDYNATSFGIGGFDFVSNGVYKFRLPITQENNFTTGDYYFMFTAIGFKASHSFPVHISITYMEENLVVIFSLIMLIISISTVIYGYWRRSMSFVVFGAFSLMLISMLMFQEQELFGATISNAFGVVFALLGLLFVLHMYLENWSEKVKEKKDKDRKSLL